ncbi:NAD(P)-dependent oxidoreductase [Hyphomicrobium facile]|uniref:3-hydroxyisobutyrate dehydrogenase n=1 Tax=Hyphomicrobium facile TaxID=51670 RepID=A0A1I7NCU1_9HYPH|nr:NAD(P)-dependent oxidoreductase [Hyphomicrobium facile]SFV32366.1 3-hydroxyisobutyrate dehydrogenase [Hyphomicrobium facile]
MNVGFIGLGHMGSGMAANLLKAGHDVTVYNRTHAKSDALASKGAKVALTPGDASKGDAVFTMLANDRALEEVVYQDHGLLASLKPGAVHISSSTISVALSKKLADDHGRQDQRYVAAPVFGRPDAAAAAKIFVVAAGKSDTLNSVSPLLDAVGQRTFTISDQPEAANIVKLSGNFLIATVIESLGEAMALVGKAGVDKHQYLEVLTSTLFGAPIYKTYGTLLADAKFQPAGFAAPLGLKDIELALAAGQELRVPLPIASLLRDRFLTLLANGGDNLDWSAIGGLAAKDAGAA